MKSSEAFLKVDKIIRVGDGISTSFVHGHQINGKLQTFTSSWFRVGKGFYGRCKHCNETVRVIDENIEE